MIMFSVRFVSLKFAGVLEALDGARMDRVILAADAVAKWMARNVTPNVRVVIERNFPLS